MIISIESPDQIDALIESGCPRAFAEEAGMHDFDPAVFKTNWLNYMKLGFGKIWTLELGGAVVGAIGGLAYPDINSGKMRSAEAFWYILPKHRGGMGGIRLFETLERWAKEIGSKYHSMFRHHETMGEKIEEFYERRGYNERETMFTKRFE